MSKIKILYVFAEPFSYGGQEAFATNMYKQINKNKFSIDFYTPYKCDNNEIQKILKENNNKILFDSYEFYTKKRKSNYIKGIKNIIKNNNYDLVHINSGSTFALAKGAKIIKRYSSAKVILHSHATGINNFKHKLASLLFFRDFKFADYFFACSNDAGRFRFLDNIVNSDRFAIINNGIDIERFKYNDSLRTKYRKLLKIYQDDFVIGHVGRLSAEKNHKFIIELFEKIRMSHNNVKLLLIGDGELEGEILSSLKEKNLLESTILLKKRNDVNKILNVMDIFIFPSLFEGLGIAAVEAQISGLTTLCSKEVPREAKITDKCIFLNLDNYNQWVKEIENEIKSRSKREYEYLKITNNKYDSKNCAKELEKIYMEVLNEN